MEKVFGIGLSKTGTTSLHAALERLGLRAVHNPESMLSIERGELTFSAALAEQYDALSDLPIAAYYRELDRAYPDARFILTTRDERAWLASCANHFDPSAFRPNAVVRKLVERVYGTPVFDPERFRAARLRHDAEARAYFAGRPDKLLVIDLGQPEKWPPLCAFLGLPIPNAPYPHENRATRLPLPLKRVLRHVRRGVRRALERKGDIQN